MKPIKWSLVVIILVFPITLFLSSCNQGYFSENEEFTFFVTGLDLSTDQSPKQINAKYIDQIEDSHPYGRILAHFHFEQVKTGAPISIDMEPAYAAKIELVPGPVYQLEIQILGGWPSVYGLMISDNNGPLFLGITDWKAGGRIGLYKLSPIQITGTELLKNHYKPGSDCYTKFTNNQINFASGGETLALHQGQTGKLGNYEVDLLVALNVEYPNPNPCYDTGKNEFSFVIYKSSK